MSDTSLEICKRFLKLRLGLNILTLNMITFWRVVVCVELVLLVFFHFIFLLFFVSSHFIFINSKIMIMDSSCRAQIFFLFFQNKKLNALVHTIHAHVDIHIICGLPRFSKRQRGKFWAGFWTQVECIIPWHFSGSQWNITPWQARQIPIKGMVVVPTHPPIIEAADEGADSDIDWILMFNDQLTVKVTSERNSCHRNTGERLSTVHDILPFIFMFEDEVDIMYSDQQTQRRPTGQ